MGKRSKKNADTSAGGRASRGGGGWPSKASSVAGHGQRNTFMKLLLAFVSMVSGLAAVNSATAAVVGDAANYNVFILRHRDVHLREYRHHGQPRRRRRRLTDEFIPWPRASPGMRPRRRISARLVVGGSLTAQNGGVGSNQQGNIYTNGPRR